MVIYIPSINDKPKKCQCNCPKQECLTTTLPTTTTVTTTTSMATNLTTTIPHTTITKLVNINIASKEELMTLNGVGEKIADKILEYRNQHPFQSIDELLNIEGIGERLLLRLKILLKSNFLYYLLIGVALVYSLLHTYIIKYQSKYDLNYQEITGTIIKINHEANKYKLEIKVKKKSSVIIILKRI